MSTRVTLLTTVDFWTPGSGHRARIDSLVRGLAGEVALTVLLPTPAPPAAAAHLAATAPQARLASLRPPPDGPRDLALARLNGFFAAHAQDACIIEFMQLSWMLPAVPPGVMRLIDTHAVASQHDAMLAQRGLLPGPVISAAQERGLLAAYDSVIAICAPDAAVYAGWLGADKVVLAPHAQPLHSSPHRPEAERLLLVAGDYPPNREGLTWFLGEVWPHLRDWDDRLTLDVVGSVGPGLGLASDQGEGLLVHGQVPDLTAAYARADLCINPVRCGGGLKIKTVEALAHGRPLITTAHGARSLEAHAGRAFAVADTPAAWVDVVVQLADDLPARERLAQTARALAADQFSAAACYGPLIAALRR
ncbi:glycosyltransferase [Roseateles sp. DC23W]|uniref:Glycosyltransferase n=1 Tax=Pelomonas dachongensis TaxID=3299029 RepID=A0ABW7EU87_9BURK